MMNLENTKVYTTDEEVISKYVELCGVYFDEDKSRFDGEIVGVAFIPDDGYEVGYFDDTSFCHEELDREITTGQINALYAEKFGIKTETPEECEALDAIAQVDSEEWKNGGECRYSDINWLFCGFHPVNGLAIVANNDNPHSHQLITVDVNLLSKPETPQQREERERLEAAYDLYCLWGNTESIDATLLSMHAFKGFH